MNAPNVVARLLFALSLAAVATIAWAQARTLPEDARRGYLTHVQENIVDLDGKKLKLAPGGQIRNQSNLIVQPTTVPPKSLVTYQLDRNGELFRAWIMTAAEAAKPYKHQSTGEGTPIQQVLPQYSK